MSWCACVSEPACHYVNQFGFSFSEHRNQVCDRQFLKVKLNYAHKVATVQCEPLRQTASCSIERTGDIGMSMFHCLVVSVMSNFKSAHCGADAWTRYLNVLVSSETLQASNVSRFQRCNKRGFKDFILNTTTTTTSTTIIMIIRPPLLRP